MRRVVTTTMCPADGREWITRGCFLERNRGVLTVYGHQKMLTDLEVKLLDCLRSAGTSGVTVWDLMEAGWGSLPNVSPATVRRRLARMQRIVQLGKCLHHRAGGGWYWDVL